VLGLLFMLGLLFVVGLDAGPWLLPGAPPHDARASSRTATAAPSAAFQPPARSRTRILESSLNTKVISTL